MHCILHFKRSLAVAAKLASVNNITSAFARLFWNRQRGAPFSDGYEDEQRSHHAQ